MLFADIRDGDSASEVQNSFTRVYSSGYEYLDDIVANDKWYEGKCGWWN